MEPQKIVEQAEGLALLPEWVINFYPQFVGWVELGRNPTP